MSEHWSMTLHPEHIEMLKASGITPDHARARGYLTADTKAMVERYGFEKYQARPGLLVPLLGVDGNTWGWQLRADKPRMRNGKLCKYDTPAGQRNGLDIPPGVAGMLDDPSIPLWITEGAKKADAGALAGLCIIGLTGVWNWRGSNDKGGKCTLADWQDIALNDREVIVAFDGDAARKPAVGKAMRALGAWLETKGARVEYLHLPDEDDKVGLDDYLASGHTTGDLRALVQAEPPEVIPAVKAEVIPAVAGSPDRLDDAHLAEWVARVALGEHWCWAGGLGWLRWTGKVWKPTPEPTVQEAIRRVLVDLHTREALAGASIDRLRKLDGLLTAARIRGVLQLTKGVASIDADRFDRHPDLLNVGNGVVDLTTGELGAHDHRLLLTKITRVPYRRDASHPDWTQALQAMPPDVAEWMQVRFGQAATGHPTPDDIMPILTGGGSNGKSTVLSGCRRALGEHSVLTPDRVLTANPGDHPTELMTLRGARLAVLEETPEAQHLNVQRLKALVGTAEMNARHIRQDNVTWAPTHSLMIATNYEPRVDESDHGTWRRLALVRFPYTFPVSSLRERIEGNHDGQLEAVLAWIVAGAVAWYADGRVMPARPERVQDDTAAWRAKSDRVLAYASDRLVFDESACVTSADLYADFCEWLTERGHRAWTDQTFTDRFGAHSEVTAHEVVKARTRSLSGLVRRSGFDSKPAQAMVWQGVRWRTDSDDESSPRAGVCRGVPVTPTRGNTMRSPITPCTPLHTPRNSGKSDERPERRDTPETPPDIDPSRCRYPGCGKPVSEARLRAHKITCSDHSLAADEDRAKENTA